MHRFFMAPEDQSDQARIVLNHRETVKHLTKVLRVRIGEQIEVVDEKGVYIGEVHEIEEGHVALSIQSFTATDLSGDIKIELFQCLPKGQKLELILQKNVELGVSGFFLVQSGRCVSDFKGKDTDKKLERFKRIIKEAAKQSKSPSIPFLEGVLSVEAVAARIPDYDLFLVPYEDEKAYTFKRALQGFSPSLSGKKIGFIIGPEGGFDPDEVELLKRAGAQVVTLGKHILRTETAGMTATAWLQFYNS